MIFDIEVKCPKCGSEDMHITYHNSLICYECGKEYWYDLSIELIEASEPKDE